MRQLSLVAVGDISFGADVARALRHYDPFEFVKKEIIDSDISIGNLECVICDRGKATPTYTHLRTSSENVKHLKIFTILSLANNHILDYGIEGMNETANVLNENHILTLGVGNNYRQAVQPLVLERGSMRIGFISFVHNEVMLFPSLTRARNYGRPGPARYYDEDVLEKVQKLKKIADLIIASIHWGVEFVHFPSPRQRSLAKRLIDNGVDLIIGHHSHVVQGIERYRNGLIFYSLGNLIFDPAIGGVESGLMVKFILSEKGVSGYKLIPLEMNENYQPVKLTQEETFFRYVERICKPLADLPCSFYKNFWFENVARACLNSYKSDVLLMKKYGIRYLAPFFLGLMLPYSIRCYAGFFRQEIRKLTG